MPHILNDFSTPALINAVKQNLYELFGHLRTWDQAEFYTRPGLQRWWTPVAYPWYNGAMSLTPPAGNEAETIAETIAYFHAKGRGVFTWWLAPDVETSTWGQQLQAHGLRIDNNTPGMAVDLSTLNEAIKVPAGFSIKRLEDDLLMHTWAKIFVEGYGLPPNWEIPVRDLMRTTGITLPMHSYLGTVNDEPVAVSAIFYGAGVAGIQMVATLPEWRGKGLGAAITLKPLHDAREMGFCIGILQASEMGFSIYQRLGFKEICRMNHFFWKEE